MISETPLPETTLDGVGRSGWSYDVAFARHRGLLSADDQARLGTSRVAVAGMGGVGGVHLITLARLGIGSFSIADPDTFDVPNFNRQYGANVRTLGRNKAQVMAEEVRANNPSAHLRVWNEGITPANVGDFLDGAKLFVDGVDFFAFPTRRLLFREARARGMWAVTAGPLGFSSAWLLFSPTGMSFDEYFDMNDQMEPIDQLVAFLVGLCPAATQRGYIDLTQVDPRTSGGPSSGLACQLCSGIVGAEAVKILLGRGPLRPVPHYSQFDAYCGMLRRGRLWWGNRHPLQRLKRWIARRRMLAAGWDKSPLLLSAGLSPGSEPLASPPPAPELSDATRT
jgi:molybdopterin/thiamine biosynthesis adenylyltransferase